MNNKIVAILIIIAAIAFGSYIFMQNQSGVISQAELESLRGDSDYYKYVTKCETNPDTRTCCLKSLKAIKEGGYAILKDASCSEGEKIDTLKCAGSYKWCIPAI